MQRLLANENIPLSSVHALREEGFDVFSVSESAPGLKDAEVLSLARSQERILFTFDRDYGELVFRHGLPCPRGVVYLRFDPVDPLETFRILRGLLTAPERVLGQFVVLGRDDFRRRPLPLSTA